MATNNMSKFDNVSKNLLHSGSPDVYQITTKKESIGSIPKMIVGKRDSSKVNKTILLIGETGTGKSTMINALVNYALGVTWEDNVWFEIVQEEKRSQVESQTSDVVVYEIFGFEGKALPFSLTIVDTPGYGDTRGAEKDEMVSQRLFDLFRSKDGVHEINVVALVLKAGINRLSDRLRYIFDSLVSLFGKDMEKNIISLITHSDGMKPKNVLKALEAANIKCARDDKKEPVHFVFNNRQSEDRTEDEDGFEDAFNKTAKWLKKFFDFLDKTSPQKMGTTVEVLKKRIRLKACIQNLNERAEYIEQKQKPIQQMQDGLRKREEELMKVGEKLKKGQQNQKEIQEMQKALKKFEEDAKRNENFTVEVDEPYKVKEKIDGGRKWYTLWTCKEGAVTCNSCEENCHYPCPVAWDPNDCDVMTKGYCTACKCSVGRHVKDTFIYKTRTRRVEKTMDNMKEKYLKGVEDGDKAKAKLKELEKSKINLGPVEKMYQRINKECEEIAKILEGLRAEMAKNQQKRNEALEESFQHVLKLEEIALNTDSMSTHVHLDFLIQQMTKDGNTEKVKILEEMKTRVDEGTRAGLEYMQTAAGGKRS